MAEAFSDKEIIQIESNTFRHTGGYASSHNPEECDHCRFLATIEQLKKDAEIKDSLAEGVMTLAEVYEQLQDAKAEIERLRGALEEIYDRAIGHDGFGYTVKVELRKIARQALDAGKE